MFVVVRSVFWLSLAYMVISPGVELPDSQALAAQAMAAGSKAVSAQIDKVVCADIVCLGGKAVATAALQPSPPVGTPMHASPTTGPAPIPRPRPDWAG